MARPFPLSSFPLGWLPPSSSSSSSSSSLPSSRPPFAFPPNDFCPGPVPLEPGEREERGAVCVSGEVMYRLASRDGVGVVFGRGRSGSDSLGRSEDMLSWGENVVKRYSELVEKRVGCIIDVTSVGRRSKGHGFDRPTWFFCRWKSAARSPPAERFLFIHKLQVILPCVYLS